MIPTYLTVGELADAVRVHPDTIRFEIAQGNLPAIKLGGFKIDPQDAQEWIESRRVGCAKSPAQVDSRRGNPEESRFSSVARQMEGRDRAEEAEDVHLKRAS